MHLSVGFPFHAQGQVSKGRRFLSDAPVGRFPNPWLAATRKLETVFFGHFPSEASIRNVRFGRSLAQLILGALSIHPFEVKEGPERSLLSDVPFGRFCLAMYPSADFAPSGASWLWVVFNRILACWDLRGWSMAFWILAFGFPPKGSLRFSLGSLGDGRRRRPS